MGFNQLDSWTADYFKLGLPDYGSGLVQNQSALERFMLLLLGFGLKTGGDEILDFVIKKRKILWWMDFKQLKNNTIHLCRLSLKMSS
ncbi:MAG TPA: hypothetical protein VI146_06230 [Nitrososphaeraceae archaeon]